MDQLASFDKSKMPSSFLEEAETILAQKWSTLEGRLATANGKSLISAINGWIRSKYKRNCSRNKLISALEPEDISQEIKDLVKELES